MSEVLFSQNGTPLIGYGKGALITTKGAPKNLKGVDTTIKKLDETLSFNKYVISPWGSDNNFPGTANDAIRKTGVLNSGLKFIRNFTLGQGIFPCRITGFDDDGNEILQVIDDPKLRKFVNGRIVRRYLETALRDYLKFGRTFPQLIPNADASQIVGINTINALWCRLTEAKAGMIENCIVYGYWPDAPGEKKDWQVYDVLDNYDPFADLERRRFADKVKGKSFIYPLQDSWSNNDYYAEPIWYSAYLAGWVDIANQVPTFLKKAYQNQITWKWHVQIPYAYWDKRFPETEFADKKTRQAAIEAHMDEIETRLVGTENANKAIFTFFAINEINGKAEEKWEISPLENKYKEGDKLITSAAANSEILFSLMLNPNVMGAGMPGGTYAGNQGGSNIREAFLVNIANSWLDRQNILDPIECMLEYNGVKDIELRFRNTILTTLDTGAGSQKTIS